MNDLINTILELREEYIKNTNGRVPNMVVIPNEILVAFMHGPFFNRFISVKSSEKETDVYIGYFCGMEIVPIYKGNIQVYERTPNCL